MINKLKAASLAFLVVVFGYAATAQAGQFNYTATKSGVYALELFGSGSDNLVLDYPTGSEPKVVLTFANPQNATGHTIAAGQKGNITFTLHGATFAERVRASHLAVTVGGSTTVTKRVVSGGARASASVTYEVEVSAGTVMPGNSFTFTLPPVTNAATALTTWGFQGVRMSASWDPLNSDDTGTNDFPEGDQPLQPVRSGSDSRTYDPNYFVTTVVPSSIQPRNSGERLPGSPPWTTNKWGVTMAVANGRGGLINVDDRTSLASASRGYVALGTVGVTVDSSVMQANGSPFSVAAGQAGAGFLTVSTSGEVPMGSMFLDLDGDSRMDTGESGSIAISAAVNGRTNWLVAIPDGSSIIRPGQTIATFAMSFTANGSRQQPPVSAYSEVTYDGAGTGKKAYAIASAGSSDVSNVRVKCESSTRACQVYFACDAQSDGADIFGKAPEEIQPLATMVYSGSSLADIFGDDWSGRLGCEVISVGGDISVQVLTRAAGVLVNNTYVED